MADEFPNDETEWSDVDGDGIGDNKDTFNDLTGEQIVFFFQIDTDASTQVLAAVEATGALTSVTPEAPVLKDVQDGVVPTFTNDAPAEGFAVGSTTVTWTVSYEDEISSVSYVRTFAQQVVVEDTTAPVLSS